MNKNLIFVVSMIAILVIAVGGYIYPLQPDIDAALGAFDIPTRFPNGHLDTNGGYYVDGTVIINGSGALTPTTISATGAVDFDSTLNVDGTTNVELFTSGGGVLSTSTESTAMVPTAATFNYGLIQVTPEVADLTYTFPASSTMSAIVPNAGDVRTVVIYNATTTAGIDVIFAAGAGMEIKGTGSTPLTIDEASMGTLTFVRKANSDILVFVNPAVAD